MFASGKTKKRRSKISSSDRDSSAFNLGQQSDNAQQVSFQQDHGTIPERDSTTTQKNSKTLSDSSANQDSQRGDRNDSDHSQGQSITNKNVQSGVANRQNSTDSRNKLRESDLKDIRKGNSALINRKQAHIDLNKLKDPDVRREAKKLTARIDKFQTKLNLKQLEDYKFLANMNVEGELQKIFDLADANGDAQMLQQFSNATSFSDKLLFVEPTTENGRALVRIEQLFKAIQGDGSYQVVSDNIANLAADEKSLQQLAAISTVKLLPSWQQVPKSEQDLLAKIFRQEKNLLSQIFRRRVRELLETSNFLNKKPDKQVDLLVDLIDAQDSIPYIVNDIVSAKPVEYTSETTTQKGSGEFRMPLNKGKNPLVVNTETTVVKFDDNVQLSIISPVDGIPGDLVNHTAKEVADALSYLPKASREEIKAIVINPVVNPEDHIVAAEFNKDSFHSYMSVGKDNAIIHIYPNTFLEEENFLRATLIHETGHTWSYVKWGTDTNKDKWIEWKKAMAKDRIYVSGYAKEKVDEDVAETIKVYVSTKGTKVFEEYRQMFTNRFAMLDKEYT